MCFRLHSWEEGSPVERDRVRCGSLLMPNSFLQLIPLKSRAQRLTQPEEMCIEVTCSLYAQCYWPQRYSCPCSSCSEGKLRPGRRAFLQSSSQSLHQRKTHPGLEVEACNPCYLGVPQVQGQPELCSEFKTCAIQQDTVSKERENYQEAKNMSSVVECLLSTCEALGSILSPENTFFQGPTG